MKVVKTQELGTVITEVPAVEYIRIEPSETSERGVHVEIKIQGIAPMSFGIEEFGEFAYAVALANDRVTWLADRNEKGA